MLVTHWGFSGPVILRLSAWGARDLSDSDYKGEKCFILLPPFFSIFLSNQLNNTHAGSLLVDFVPDLNVEDLKSFLIQHKNKCAVIVMI